MPQFSSTPNLEVFYSSDASGTNEYGYNTLSMVSGIPDVSQLQIIWKVAIVLNSSGNPVAVSSFTDAEQEILQTLSASMYNVDADSKKVTLLPDEIKGGEVTLNGAVYTYDSSFAGVSSADPLYIRRSTDVTSRAVIFQPGSRLTEELLNTSSAQVFNAMQELTAFGSGGGGAVGSIDLQDNSINDLGDVNLTTNGILYWDGSEVTSDNSSGGLVPDPNSAQDGMVLTRTSPGSSLYDWEFTQWANVLSSGGVSLDSQISTMSGSIQANTNAVAAASAESVPAYVTIAPNAYQNSAGQSTSVDISSSSGDSSENVNIFLYTSGNRFSGLSSLADMCPVGDVAYDGGSGFSAIVDCKDSSGANFFSFATTSNGVGLFKRAGLYRVDLSGIFSTNNTSSDSASGGFRILKDGVGSNFGQNPISTLPASGAGTEYISNSFLIPVTQADVDNATQYGFYITNNRPASETSKMNASRIQFTLNREGGI